MSESEVGKCMLLDGGLEVPGDRRIWRKLIKIRDRATTNLMLLQNSGCAKTMNCLYKLRHGTVTG